MQGKTSLRLIIENGVTASFGLAADDELARRVGLGESQPTLRLYTYQPHCALVGRFQQIENEIHLDWCRTHEIAVNRRPTGGGAILMGSDQLGVALTVPGVSEDIYGQARSWMGRFSAAIVSALSAMGIMAGFRRKNDIEVEGRKIAGLGLYRATGGGLLFHASLLVDMDVALMLQVLHTPFEKISDKEVASITGRISTVRRELKRPVSLDEVRDIVAESYSTASDVQLERGSYTSEEREAIVELERKKYMTREWIFQSADVPDFTGSAKHKTAGGLLDVRVALAGRMLKSVLLAGDFFAAERAVANLEAALRWHPAAPQAVAATVQQIYMQHPGDWHAVSVDDVTQTIQMAIRRAEAAGNEPKSLPYGCFVPVAGA